jgi:hypothetical protein
LPEHKDEEENLKFEETQNRLKLNIIFMAIWLGPNEKCIKSGKR